jgi:hypothetical protein
MGGTGAWQSKTNQAGDAEAEVGKELQNSVPGEWNDAV